jgi:hypothetical protein
MNTEHESCFRKRQGAVVVKESPSGGLDAIQLVKPKITAS